MPISWPDNGVFRRLAIRAGELRRLEGAAVADPDGERDDLASLSALVYVRVRRRKMSASLSPA